MTKNLTSDLTLRQNQIIALAIQGLVDKEIAVDLGIGTGSIKTHWQRIRFKMNAKTRAEIIARVMASSAKNEQQFLGERTMLREIFEGSGAGIALMDRFATFVEVNLAFAGMFQCAPVDLVGECLSDLLPGDLVSRADSVFQNLWEGSLPTVKVWTFPDKLGHPVTVKASVNRIEVGEEQFLLATTDILSEHSRSDRQLLQDHDRYKAISENSPQFIWIARPDGYVEYCNPWFQAFSGATPAQTEGCGCVVVIHSDDIQKSKDRWSVAQTVCEPYEAQARFRRLDGSYHWHQIKMRPIKDAHGQVSQWVGCAFDIHQIRMVEEEHEKLLQLVTSQNSLNERHLKRG